MIFEAYILYNGSTLNQKYGKLILKAQILAF